MKIAVLGTGMVGRSLAGAFSALAPAQSWMSMDM